MTDFGIAKVIGGADAVATTNGDILGTPAYMAPEQATGGSLGPAADVYAAGVMLYELLSGQLPYSQDGGGLAIVYRHLHENPIPLPDVAPQIPRPVAEVVMRALAREPGDRYVSAEEFAVAIGEAAVDGFGGDWYTGSGIRVIGSERVMGTLTGTGLYRRRNDATVARSPDTVQQSPPTIQQSPPTVQQSPPTVQQSPPTQPGGLFGGSDSAGIPLRPLPDDGFASANLAASPSAALPVPRPQPIQSQPIQSQPIQPQPARLQEIRPIDALPRVHPQQARHVVGVLAVAGKPQPLVPVRQILDVPRAPTLTFALAGVFLVLMLVGAWVGIGTSNDGSGSTTGTVTVAGTDVSHGGDVTADPQVGDSGDRGWSAGRRPVGPVDAVRARIADRPVGQDAAAARSR